MPGFTNLGFNCEGVYLDKFIELIRENFEDSWNLVFAFHKIDIPEPHEPTLVFQSGQEDHSPETPVARFTNVKLVFRQHCPLFPVPEPKLRPIPLTPIAKFDENETILPASQRKYDYFWAGVRNINRDALEAALAEYQLINPNGKVFWGDKWGEGIDRDQYCYYLANSKITFAPRGWISPETYRYSEAMRAGCITIADPQFGFWYNEYSAYFWPGAYQELPQLMTRLLSDSARLDHFQQQTLEYYRRCLSPEAAVKFVSAQVQGLSLNA